MYKRRGRQINILESPLHFGGVALDPANQWAKPAEQTPWEFNERRYAERFKGLATGNPAKSSRMAIGALIIKERYPFSDEDVVEDM